MPPFSDPFEEITSLTSRLLDGELTAAEHKHLSRLLAQSPEAQAHYLRLHDLHAMFESEPRVREAMTNAALPNNVVSLPGSNSGLEFVPGSRRHFKMAWAIGAGAAAAVLMGGALIFRAAPSEQEVIMQTAPVVSGSPAPADLAPEMQYAQASIPSANSNSLKRPPTNFSSEPSLAGETLSYNRHIRPILSENCFACHGPDEAGRKAKLRLDTFEGATQIVDGNTTPAIVIGDPDASALIARILSQDSEDQMPPPDSHKKLTPAQIDLLQRWIKEGATWEGHWAFEPIGAPSSSNEARSPAMIDALVDKELARHQLSRAPEAARSTLVRRAYLDLTGLPPTPEETVAFATDTRPDAYERMIDELLTRPAYGEHRARYWLDAARYGDTHGLHLDNYREIWAYRDWVINAYNANMPFDQFTVEQLAGDLLPNATQAQQIATGFNRCNVTTSEGGAIEEEFLTRYAVDRVSTTATVWLGLTAGCAQCHDHKFDPITAKDFYSLYAFFNNTTQPGMDGNAKDSPPVIRIYDSPEAEARAKELGKEISTVEAAAKTALDGFNPSGMIAADHAPAFRESGEAPALGRDTPFSVAFRFALKDAYQRTVLVSATDPQNQDRGWRIVSDNGSIVVELIESYPNQLLKRGTTRRFKNGGSGHFAMTYDGSGRGDGIAIYLNGEKLASRFVNQWINTLEGDFSNPGAILLIGDTTMTPDLAPRVTEVSLESRRLVDPEIASLANWSSLPGIEKKDVAKRSEKEQEMLKTYLATRAPGAYRDALVSLAPLSAEHSRIEAASTTTLVMSEKAEAPMATILLRGEYDQPGDKVTPAFPAFLPVLDPELPMNRLGLARWLVHPEHPLTARVIVNRVWQELFGVGLVKTSEDFGTQGENPSHPELLEWLARTYIDSGWDSKALYRIIMLSETYRQDSRTSPELVERDPENRLLARGPRFRLDAEVIRDQALFASGLLDDHVGGPSVKPYQPAGIWEAVGYTNSNTQTFFQDFGPSTEGRRSLYSFWKRTAQPPGLALFDAPNRESCTVRRERTNTPLQALVLMNDPQYVRAARFLALRVIREMTDRDERLDRLAEHLRSRPLSESERRIVVNSFDQFRNIYESDPVAAAALLVDEVNPGFSITPDNTTTASELATWTMVASQMMNLDEVVNKN